MWSRKDCRSTTGKPRRDQCPPPAPLTQGKRRSDEWASDSGRPRRSRDVVDGCQCRQWRSTRRDYRLCHDFEARLSPFIAVPMVDVLVVEKRDQDDNRYRNPEKPKQKGTAHIILLGAAQARILSRQEHSLGLICSRALSTISSMRISEHVPVSAAERATSATNFGNGLGAVNHRTNKPKVRFKMEVGVRRALGLLQN